MERTIGIIAIIGILVCFVGLGISMSQTKAATRNNTGTYEIYMSEGSGTVLMLNKNTGDSYRLMATRGRESGAYWTKIVVNNR